MECDVSWDECIKRFEQEQIIDNIGKHFNLVEKRYDGYRWMHNLSKDLSAIMSFSYRGEQVWKHVSFARRKQMIQYEKLEEFKSIFCGDDVYAMIVFPPKSKWVSIHKYCVHLWEPMETYPLPEFSGFLPGKNFRSI